MDLGCGRLLLPDDGQPEVRYEPGDVVREDQFPPQADIGWFIARGALVETGIVEPEPELEPEPESIEEEEEEEEVVDG